MSLCIKDSYDYDLVKKRSECGILRMETNFYFRKINQKYRKECAQCTKTETKCI